MTIPWRILALLAGPLLALAAYSMLPEQYTAPDGAVVAFSQPARATLAVLLWMAWWWLTESLDVFATALVPLAVFPLLGVATFAATAAPYADSVVFLFLGGFIIAQAMQRCGLDRRIALLVLSLTGPRPAGMVAGIMVATALLSMWVSNTATAAMMMPIALSIVDLVAKPKSTEARSPSDERHARNFATFAMLGMAYAASIGGLGTIIGSPPNGIVVEYLRSNHGVEISFLGWMRVGVPLVLLFLPVCWLLLRLLFPPGSSIVQGGRDLIRAQRASLGAMKREEWIVLVVFVAAAALWMVRPWLAKATVAGGTPFSGLSDGGIAIGAALLLFVIPATIRPFTAAIDWATAEKLPWGVLVLFGGGLTLAAAIQANGVDRFFAAHAVFIGGLAPLLAILAIAVGVVLLSELASNTAAAAIMMPIVAALAPTLGMRVETLVVTAGLAASCGFMLPVATPPNAIAYGSGRVPLQHMYRAGFLLDLIGAGLVTATVALLVS